jgi:hypothetical protein
MSDKYLMNLSKQHNLRESIVNALKEFDVQSDDELSAVLGDSVAFAALRSASLAQALLLQRHFTNNVNVNVKQDVKKTEGVIQQQQSKNESKSASKAKAVKSTTPSSTSSTTPSSSTSSSNVPSSSSSVAKSVTERIQAFFQDETEAATTTTTTTTTTTNKKNGGQQKQQQQKPSAAAAAAAAAVAPSVSSSDRLSVVSWNVLSHVRSEAHTDATMRGERRRESMQQCHARHAAITHRLAILKPDVALLQDIDDDLIKSASLDAEFHFVRQDSCAVLLRRDAWRVDASALAPAALSVAATPENGSGAAVVLVAESVARPKTSVALVSLQCGGGGSNGDDERRGLLIEQVCNSLAVLPTECAVVMGGDFGVASQRDELCERLQQQAECASVPFAKPSCTMLLNGAKFDKSLSVDRLAVRGATPTSELTLGRFPGKADGRGPYGDDIGDGSDHVWLACEFEI